MSLGELGNNLLDVVESAVFGTANTSQETTSVNPLYDDEFFHPLVVHDDEPCKWILHHKIRHLHVKLWDLLIFVPCSIFFSFLVSGLTKTKQKATFANQKSVMNILISAPYKFYCKCHRDNSTGLLSIR